MELTHGLKVSTRTFGRQFFFLLKNKTQRGMSRLADATMWDAGRCQSPLF